MKRKTSNFDIRRIGVMVPSTDAVVEWDYKNLLPENIAFHTARMKQHDNTKRCVETLDEICEGIEEAASSLIQIKPEVIVFACTAAGFHQGEGWDTAISRRIVATTGVSTIIAAQAVTAALRHLRAKHLFVFAPYTEKVTKLEIEYLERNGFNVADYIRINCDFSRDLADIPPSCILDMILTRRAEIKACDALFVSCTGLRSTEIVGAAEKELGIPVVTSNSACLWTIMKSLKLEDDGIVAGQLFSNI
jgi:maleate isomerase